MLFLPYSQGFLPLAALVSLVAQALLWAAGSALAWSWRGMLLAFTCLIVCPAAMASRALRATALGLRHLLLVIFSRLADLLARPSTYEEVLTLRSSLSCLEKRLKRAERRLLALHHRGLSDHHHHLGLSPPPLP